MKRASDLGEIIRDGGNRDKGEGEIPGRREELIRRGSQKSRGDPRLEEKGWRRHRGAAATQGAVL